VAYPRINPKENFKNNFLKRFWRGKGDTKLVGVAPVETKKRPSGPETVAGIYHLIPSTMS
jgi:hypothetical protein